MGNSNNGIPVLLAANRHCLLEAGLKTAPRIIHHPSDVVVKVGNPATLSCRADGSPEPTIEWLRNGQPLQTVMEDSQSQALILSDGSLFFLSASGGRRGQSHEGIYTCVARNSAGKATSRNASLYIAVLREEFSVQPSDVEVAEGEMAVLNCGPPVGHPEPHVTWRKDGLPINTTDQHYTVLSGKLIIAPAERNHSGVYVCVASNTVGVRESRAARLSAASTKQKDLHRELSALRVALENVTIMAPGSNMSQVQWKVLENHYASPLAVSIMVSHEQNNTVHLSWEPPPHETHNGIIQGYQVWCVESEVQQYQNWTVDSSRHSLDISNLNPGKRYWITVAAVNGAGPGVQSDPSGFVIGEQPNSDKRNMSQVMAVLRDPVLIGSVGALLWCVLMATAVCLFRRHTRTGHLGPGCSKGREPDARYWDSGTNQLDSASYLRTSFVPLSSSRSTKLTVDMGSLQSVCAASGHLGHPAPTHSNTNTSCPSYSRLSTASYCMSLDEEQGSTLTSQEVTQYLELSPKPESHSGPSQYHPSLSHPFSPTLGYICGPLPSNQLEDNAAVHEQEAQLIGSRRARLQSTPSSCYSEWDSSLWNTWGSVVDSNMASARTSLISSVDSSYMNDTGTFARVLAVAAESISGASFSGKQAKNVSSVVMPFTFDLACLRFFSLPQSCVCLCCSRQTFNIISRVALSNYLGAFSKLNCQMSHPFPSVTSSVTPLSLCRQHSDLLYMLFFQFWMFSTHQVFFFKTQHFPPVWSLCTPPRV
uniref:Roundabout, axon guidance receptor, homolog 4 (Drosophila) n=1 Tax=Myripristis murdjan TaxID=586833 RepID=A0A667Z7G4_9TELE